MTTDEVFKDFKIMANKKILENHKYEIYYSESEKSWRTYLPDETKPNKRRPVKRKSKENLEKEIIRFYIEKQKAENRQNITLEELYAEWPVSYTHLDVYKRQLRHIVRDFSH